VRYESDRNFLNFYHGRQSYDIGVEVGRHAADAYRYRLPDVLAALLGPDHTSRTSFQASTPSAVASCMQQIAELVDTHFGPVLEGDREAWKRIVDVTAARNREYTKEVVQQPVRRAAEEAWTQRNYRKVCELYESIRSDLAPVEEKRLEFALKHRWRHKRYGELGPN